MKVKVSQVLKSNWVWKQHGEDEDISVRVSRDDLGSEAGWTAVSAMPSEIHVELLKNQLIPDPYIGFNEHSVQCECILINLNSF